MKNKGYAHEKLSLFFKRDGVPPNTVTDGPKEQTLGSFIKKCQDTDCYINQKELYYTCQLQAEGNIRETKKGDGRKMVRDGAPKQIWDNAM